MDQDEYVNEGMNAKPENKWRKFVRPDDSTYGEKMEHAISHYEGVLHEMTRDEWIEESRIHKYLKILYYCLFHHAISASQLFVARLCDASTVASCNKILYRLVQRGLLLSSQKRVCDSTVTLYFLSSAGLESCLNQMLELSLSYDLPLTEEDLYLLGTRSRNWKVKNNMTHFISLRDLNTYLLGNPFVGDYQYLIEPDIDLTGGIVPLKERYRSTGVKQRSGNIRSDAALLFPCHNMTYTFYLEQDTGAQRSQVIGNKLENYLPTVIGGRQDKYCHSVLFSILTSSLPSKKKKDAGVPVSVLHYASVIPNLCYFLHISLYEPGGLAKLVNMYHGYVKEIDAGKCIDSPFGRNLLTLMENGLLASADISISDFLTACKAKAADRDVEKATSDDAVHNQAYRSRRRLLQNAISGVKGIEDAYLEGFSVYFSKNRNHGDTAPYLLPELINGTFQVHALFLLSGNDCREYELSFFPVSSTLARDHFVLKNKYCAPDGFVVYVENISDDTGGRIRVSRYLENPSFHDGNGILLCLVDELDEAALWNMISESSYWQQLSADLSIPLQVLFVSYDDFARRKGYMMFTESGRLIPYAPRN